MLESAVFLGSSHLSPHRSVCIQAGAPRCACEILWRCTCRFLSGFFSSKAEKTRNENDDEPLGLILLGSGWRCLVSPPAVWSSPPGLLCYNTGAFQKRRTTYPKPSACLLSSSGLPPSFSSQTLSEKTSQTKKELTKTDEAQNQFGKQVIWFSIISAYSDTPVHRVWCARVIEVSYVVRMAGHRFVVGDGIFYLQQQPGGLVLLFDL